MAFDISIDALKKAAPSSVRNSITQPMVDKMNSLISDPIVRESYRDNLIGYIHVMKDGRFKMDSYVDAVRYVSYKLMGGTNLQSYIKTFPDRYQYFINKSTSDKDIASYVSSYSKNKLVNLILEQSVIPSFVFNAELHQSALNRQAYLMVHANSEMVQMQAANSILLHTKAPDTSKIEIDIGLKENSILSELRKATSDFVVQQKRAIADGTSSVKEIAHSKITREVKVIEGELVSNE